MFYMTESKIQVSRRTALKRVKHLLLGSATAYLALTKTYDKPSLTKIKNLYDSAAMADSVGGGGGGVGPD
jgi:hypothetical protein